MATDAFDILSRRGGAAYSGVSVKESFGSDGRYHDIRRPKDSRLIPLSIAGGLVAVLAALCIALLLYTLVVGPVAKSGIFGGTGDAIESLTDNRGAVQLPVYASGLDSRGSRIPVHITGTKSDGSSYDQHGYVSHDGSGIKLDPGSYDFVVEETPISSAGVLYTVPGGVTSVEVSDDGTVNYVSSASLIFSEIAALSVTDDQIASAREFIANDPERNMYADELADRARTRRSDAQAEVDKAKAEAEAQQKAAEEAAQKTAQQQEEEAKKQAEEQASSEEKSSEEGTNESESSSGESSSSTEQSGTGGSSTNEGSSSSSGTSSGTGESGTGTDTGGSGTGTSTGGTGTGTADSGTTGGTTGETTGGTTNNATETVASAGTDAKVDTTEGLAA